MTSHGTPLSVGPGSANVMIGFLPAWRGVPLAAAAALQTAQTAADIAMKTAETATKAAAGTPGAPAALAAEQTLKSSLAVSMGSMMSSFGGMSDIHTCPVPVPAPPHGPGVVINGSPTVSINFMPACRQGDTVLEALGGADSIAMGCMTVMIGDSGGGGGGGPSESGQLSAAQDKGTSSPAAPATASGAKATLIDDPAVKAAMKKAAEDSDIGGKNPHEEGGWILRDPKTGALSVERVPTGKGAELSWTVQKGKRGDKDIVGSFHTHPNVGPGWTQGPSPQDLKVIPANPGTFGADHYVTSQDKIYHIDSKGTQSTVGKTKDILK